MQVFVFDVTGGEVAVGQNAPGSRHVRPAAGAEVAPDFQAVDVEDRFRAGETACRGQQRPEIDVGGHDDIGSPGRRAHQHPRCELDAIARRDCTEGARPVPIDREVLLEAVIIRTQQ